MRLSLAIALIVASGQAAIAADPALTCKALVTNFMAAAESKSTKLNDTNPSMAYTVGFFLGAYHGATGEKFEGIDKSNLGRLEKDVIAECSRRPKEVATQVILDIVSKLREQPKPAEKETAQSGNYSIVEITDFMLDIAKLKGKRVKITGELQTMGDIAMIGPERFSMNKAFVETKSLPREQRKKILEECEGGCTVTVSGKVGTVMFNDGLIAEDLQVN